MTDTVLLSRPLKRAEVPSAGTTVTIVASDEERRRIAAAFGLEACGALTATLHVRPVGHDGLAVHGELLADVTYRCVVTLEPVAGQLEEPIDVSFAPPVGPHRTAEDIDIGADTDDPPEPLVGGVADLGPVVTEHLALGLDPYPRAPGAILPAPEEKGAEDSPFARLAALRDRPPRKA